MADLEFVDQHNMVACLERTDGNAEFHQIVDFLTTSPIHYALTVSPTIYASYIEQFWATAKSKTVNNVKQIHATVDGKTVVISESSVRSDLHFNDEDGITCLSNDEIFVNLALMGYERVSTKLTFQKAFFSPQWKYLIHTILHCLSSKTTAWNEFSTNLASAVICLAKGQKFGEDSMKLLELMELCTKLLDLVSKKKRKMFHIKYALTESPTIYVSLIEQFWQTAFASTPENGEMEITATIDGKVKHKRLLLPYKRTYIAPTLTHKLFSNMRRASKGYTGVNTPLFQTMLVQGQNVQGEGSTILVESHHTPTSAPSTLQPQTSSPSMQTIHAAPMPHDSPIPRVHSLGSDKGSLTLNELTGRSLVEDMDLDDGISLVPPHVSDQGRFDDKHVSDQPEEQLGVFSATKVLANAARIRRGVVNVHTYTRRRTISTAGMAGVSTASGLVITTGMAQEVEINIPSPVATKDKGKLHEEEQARFNAEQEVKFNEEQEQERLDYEAADDILARVTADEDLVQKLQVGEKYNEEDLPRKLVELVNQRKKFFAQQRAEAKRNKPMTPAQQKAYMSTYMS
ncbi:hypothetical protein Tco_0856473 [Tanacetum coccineum]|uniref:Uncharacterized protein n=1 Tax=Tanacetum coccineum TaxID=301880 RepID=A0ABQ5B474_9ASTR